MWQIPDLIGIQGRGYLDRSELAQHRSIANLMRYAALNQGAERLGATQVSYRPITVHSCSRPTPNLIGHLRQVGASHAHLHTGEPTGLGRIQSRFERPRRERGGCRMPIFGTQAPRSLPDFARKRPRPRWSRPGRGNHVSYGRRCEQALIGDSYLEFPFPQVM
jgi:hypothetical protein